MSGSKSDVDRISNLPESVLCHMLSLLPTKDAVATSLLSTRWKFLWTNIHNLSFDDDITLLHNRDATNTEVKFAHFVNKVLLLLNQQTIHKFSLKINECCELYDVTTWIAAAVARNVKVVELYYLDDFYYKSPCRLFNCKTLEVLHLFFVKNLNVPSLVCLPNLKTLLLQKVSYQLDSEAFRNLISGCSSLETLYIQRDVYDNVFTFAISSPTLRNLIFKDDTDPGYLGELPYNLEIDTPALRYLYLFHRFSRDLSVGNLRLLDEANIQSKYMNYEEIDCYVKAVVKLLQGADNVKHLSLDGDILEALSHARAIPSFQRLMRLTVEVEYGSCHSLLDWVKSLNKLECLAVKQCYGYKDSRVTCWREPEKVPICFDSCFQKMSIHGFKGEEDELAMVAYILKNAKVLRTMTIEVSYNPNMEDKFRLLQKVAKFPRGSAECEITFF